MAALRLDSLAFAGDLDRELKYVLPVSRLPFVAHWLASVCRPDLTHPIDDVWTVYYDTPGLRSLNEKLASDYLKTKVRVRWYSRPGEPAAGEAFFEVKRRVGDRREKARVALPEAASTLAATPLDDRLWRDLPARAGIAVLPAGALWRPVVALVYRRARFVERTTGARVSSDGPIALIDANPAVLAGPRPGPLPIGVVEIKGPSDELPVSLRTLPRFGARLSSFSKYAAVLQHARQQPA